MNLTAHPARPPLNVSAITVGAGMEGSWLLLRWRVEGAGALVVPPFAGRGRADGLWQATCFEAFLQSDDGSAGYVELNLSPSEQWAAYSFTGRREGMAEVPMPRDADCALRGSGNLMIFDAAVPLATLPPRPWRLGMTAVIEERAEGMSETVKSYWALAHGGAEPDFHDPACFVARLGAGEGA
ncbi:DOMON-like domain-containing protein [Novosphingobium sp. 9]|uniref:DOMON-like domain-containing protein n=1 Tax=Novosphingobium sp. 9 TaxID=2025349 RepID=UPI0021B6B2AF|nr:DOMON-like domain-containing protein [Novosphingobium sp. 9]